MTQRFDIRAPSAVGLAGRGVVLAYVGVLVGLPLLALIGRAVARVWPRGRSQGRR